MLDFFKVLTYWLLTSLYLDVHVGLYQVMQILQFMVTVVFIILVSFADCE